MVKKEEKPSFEKAIQRLQVIVESLEKETVSLEESLKLFEEGMKLTAVCRSQLEAAETRIKELSAQAPSDERERGDR